jgi:hypothetical protein
MMAIAKQWTVASSDEALRAKTAEMINTAIYFTSAAQHPPKQVKFDFYYVHCVTSSIFFPTFNALPFLSLDNKIRLLKFKAYADLSMYASRHCPELLLGEVEAYEGSSSKEETEWQGVFERLWQLPVDDGHAVKFGRAMAYGEQALKGYEEEEWVRIKGNMWAKIGNMIADSVESPGSRWVRSAGFDEAWKDFGEREIVAMQTQMQRL